MSYFVIFGVSKCLLSKRLTVPDSNYFTLLHVHRYRKTLLDMQTMLNEFIGGSIHRLRSLCLGIVTVAPSITSTRNIYISTGVNQCLYLHIFSMRPGNAI